MPNNTSAIVPDISLEARQLDLVALGAHYAEHRFLQLSRVVDPVALSTWIQPLERALDAAGEEIVTPHRERDGKLLGGARYLRLDPAHPMADQAKVMDQKEALQDAGLEQLGESLARDLAPIVGTILGGQVQYDRVYLLGYRNDHYLSVHDDKQTGDRINVQLPITRGCHTGLRVLAQDGLLHTHRDETGTLRFLGPRIWHEVPPIIGDPDALRLNITLRYKLSPSMAPS